MRLQQTMRKKPYLKPIVVGFAALYFLSMLLSTYLVKEKFEQEFLLSFYNIQNTIMQEFTVNNEENSGGKYMNMLVSPIWSMGKYNQFSAAIYNSDGDKIAQTAIMITFRYMHQTSISDNEPYTGKSVFYYELLDYLTEEEFAEFMKYYEDGSQYSVQAYIQEDTEELAQIKIYNLKDGAYATEEVWSWQNINVEQYTPMLITPRSNIPFELTDPTGGNYEAWLDSDYLQNYPDKIEELEEARLLEDINADTWVIEENVEKLTAEAEADITSTMYSFGDESGEDTLYILKMRYDSHPWLAAIDYLKYVYLAGFLLMLVCIIKVIYSTNKIYKQRAALEQSRRDFTNAIAHELKTPLGIIRGFAENLKENTVEEKRDYYLDQIVGQTEEMDKMVKEMIYISKLDSEELVLKKEQISMRKLVEEQVDKLEAAAESKNLEIRYHIEKDFIFEGDRYYLEKAVWNLISNAVEYNRQDGFINILINSDECCIENSGNCISEKDLAHVFEMFYSGERNNGSKEKHMGFGLYLTKRILEMHHLMIEIKNVQDGVRVRVYR